MSTFRFDSSVVDLIFYFEYLHLLPSDNSCGSRKGAGNRKERQRDFNIDFEDITKAKNMSCFK